MKHGERLVDTALSTCVRCVPLWGGNYRALGLEFIQGKLRENLRVFTARRIVAPCSVMTRDAVAFSMRPCHYAVIFILFMLRIMTVSYPHCVLFLAILFPSEILLR
jgi:hypothetical protein